MEQDVVESQSISRAQGESTVDSLRAQVNQTLSQLSSVSQEIQNLAVGNEKLRDEIVVLRERVARRLGPQPA